MTESPHDKAASVAWKWPAGGPADEELVLQARDGQVPAFEELVRRHYGLVFSIGLAWLDNPEQAEDLVQEVFVRAYLFLGRLDRPPAFHGWVAQIARNLSADWLRRGSAASRIVPMVSLDASHAEIPDTRSEGVRERMDRDEQIGAVRDAVRRLPRDQREVILLHYMEGLDQEEIAARLGMHRSSVSRMLERARKSMRGLLEPVLRDTMPALRPAPRAVGQVLAVVGTVAAMGAMQKSAIASAAGLMSVPAASVQAPVAAAASLIAILKAAGAAIVTGGTVMGVPKGIILATTAVGLTVGGVYYANRDGSPPPPPVAASPISAAAPATATTSLIPPQDEAVPPKYAGWMEAVRAFSAQHPDNKGLGHLAQALGNVNVSAAGAQRAAMDAIISGGWRGPNQAVDAVLRSHDAALTAANAAGLAAPFALPPCYDVQSPVPNFLQAQTLTKLMLCAARLFESIGQVDDAARRAMYSADLASVFSGAGQFLISHLIAVAGVSKSATTLASILGNPALTPQAAAEVLERLQKLDSRFPAMDEAVRDQGRSAIRTMRRASKDPSLRGLDPKTAQMVNSADLPNFERDADRLHTALAENIAKPFWERRKVDAASLVTAANIPLLVADPQANYDEAATRAEVARANVRLCILLAARRAGKTVTVIDPFDGQPLRTGPGIAYSVGPDRADQKGQTSYDPKNGTVSAGDVIVPMR